MLDLISTNQVAIEITTTASPLDDSLILLKDHLAQQLSRDEKGRTIPANLIIDIQALGVRKEAEINPKRWEDTHVYPIRLHFATVLLGPVYRPGSNGPCPSCLDRRWLRSRPREEQRALNTMQHAFIFGRNPGLTPSALELLSVIVETALAQPELPQQQETAENCAWLYALSLDTLQVTRHQLVQDSLCPRCATPALDTAEAATISLSSREKQAVSEYRLVKATAYPLPMKGYVNPVCGAFGAESFTELAHTVTAPVFGKIPVANRFDAHESGWGGHGYSYDASRYLGLLEALERSSAQGTRAKTTVVYDSYVNLTPDALDPRDCGLYTDQCYRALSPKYLPFDPAQKMHWVWGYSFREARPLLVPEQLVYYMTRRNGEIPFVQACSNGCAAGSCPEEAILYGLLELIERDAFLITWYARLSPPEIDPQSCSSSNTLAILDRIDRLGYDIHLFDTRLDISIPSVTAVAVLREDSLGKLVVAAGAGLDPEDAIRSALCEVAAYIPGFVHRLTNELERIREMARDVRKVSTIHDHPLLYGLPEMVAYADFLWQKSQSGSVTEMYTTWLQERPQSLDLRDDVQYCIRQILSLGMDVIVVDQTSPEQQHVGLSTVNVIVPGMMPIDFGWGRERVLSLPRLRTVPRTAGYQKVDFDPINANLTPHPFP